MNRQRFGNAFKEVIGNSNNTALKKFVNDNDIPNFYNNATQYANLAVQTGGNWSTIIDAFWELYQDGNNTFNYNPGNVNVAAAAPTANVNSVLGGVENLNDQTDDDVKAGRTFGEIFLKGWYPADITINAANNIEVATIRRPDGGAALIGSGAICGVDKGELFYNTFRAVAGNRSDKASRETTDGWFNKAQAIRLSASMAGAVGANQHAVNPATGAAVANVEDWRYGGTYTEQQICQVFALYYNHDYESDDIDDDLGNDRAAGANNIRIRASRNLDATGIVAGSQGANGILSTAAKKALFQTQFRAAGAINGAGAAPNATGPWARAANVPINNAGNAIIDKWYDLLEKLRKEVSAAGTNGTRTIPATGAAGAANAADDWRDNGYTNLEITNILAFIFAKNFEAEDVEITGNNIKVKDSAAFGTKLVGSRAIIAQDKVDLAIDRAKKVDDNGVAWPTSGSPALNDAALDSIFDDVVLTAGPGATDPKDKIRNVVAAQKLLRETLEANRLTTYPSSGTLHTSLSVAKNSGGAIVGGSPAYRAVNKVSDCVDYALAHLDYLWKNKQTPGGQTPPLPPTGGDSSKHDEAAKAGYKNQANTELNEKVKALESLTSSTDVKKIEEAITDLNEWKDNTIKNYGYQREVFESNTAAKNLLADLEKRKKELTEGGKPEGGKPEGGKPEGGKPEGGKPEGEETKKTLESVRDAIKKEFDDAKKVESSLKALAKKDEYKTTLKGINNLEEALKKFETVEALEKFQVALKGEYSKTQTGFAGHMKRYWVAYTLIGLAAIGLIAYFVFMKKPSEKEAEEEE